MPAVDEPYVYVSKDPEIDAAEVLTEENLMERSEYSCAYCGLSDVNCCIQCEDCGKWFCNRKDTSNGSHIFIHLFLSKHIHVFCHPENRYSSILSLKCENCDNNNIFDLGYIINDFDKIFFICGSKCYNDILKEAPEVVSNNYYSMISEKQIRHEFFESVNELIGGVDYKNIKYEIIEGLEKLWKNNPLATIEDVKIIRKSNHNVKPVKITYENGEEYRSVYNDLIRLENQEEIQQTSGKRFPVHVEWSIEQNLLLMKFNMNDCSIDYPLAQGGLVKFKPKPQVPNLLYASLLDIDIDNELDGKYIIDGYVRSTRKKDVVIVVTNVNNIPEDIVNTTDFVMRIIPTSVTYGSMISVLDAMCSSPSKDNEINNTLKNMKNKREYFKQKNTERTFTILPELKSIILGKKTMNYPIPNYSNNENDEDALPYRLNQSQHFALQQSEKFPLVLIQGPPGTGKTYTSAAIIDNLLKKNISKKIFVCAPSNTAVNNLTNILTKNHVKCLRVVCRGLETEENYLENTPCLHDLVKQAVFSSGDEILMDLYIKILNHIQLSAEENKKIASFKYPLEEKIVNSYDVICCTCCSAYLKCFQRCNFDTVLIDEAAQSVEPLSLIPCRYNCKKLILVGDDNQLAPIIKSKEAALFGYTRSLFNRLRIAGTKPLCLLKQYRMHPYISYFSNHMFYEGKLIDDDCTKQMDVVFKWPNNQLPFFIWNTENQFEEEIPPNRLSYINRKEAERIFELLNLMYSNGIKPEDIGVITFYNGQRTYVENLINTFELNSEYRNYLNQITINSVDGFQGQEKEYIIISCVRSNQEIGIGFLSSSRRLNVALTRAKKGLIVLGNVEVLNKHLIWNQFVQFHSQTHCIYNGELNNLQVYTKYLKQIKCTPEKLEQHLRMERN
ncbi:hypothetical protein WA158_006998 [Blastocystis sp. Blastoise]